MTHKCIHLMPYIYLAEYANLAWSVYILLATNFWFRHAFVVSSTSTETEASKHIIYPWKWNHKDVFLHSLLHLEIYDISSNAQSEGQWKTRWVIPMSYWWRVAKLREQTDLHYKNIAFWVDLLLPWVNLFLPWAICFCREQIARFV